MNSTVHRMPVFISGVAVYWVVVFFAILFVFRSAFFYEGQIYFSLFDDAMIAMRYAHNLAEGHGLVWNPGELPVEGYTNFLWVLWMSVPHWLGIDQRFTSLFVSVSGLLILLISLWVTRKIISESYPNNTLAPIVGQWLVATQYGLIFWTLRGLEVGAVSLVFLLAVWSLIRIRNQQTEWIWLLMVFSIVGVLLRLDTVLILFWVGLFAWCQMDRGWCWPVFFWVGGGVALTLAINFLWRHYYYDEWLPNTYYLKLDSAPDYQKYVRGLLSLFKNAGLYMALPLVFAVVGSLVKASQDFRYLKWCIWCAFLSMCAYNIAVGGDAWEAMSHPNRFLLSVTPLILVLAAVGLSRVIEWSSGYILVGITLGLLVSIVTNALLSSEPALQLPYRKELVITRYLIPCLLLIAMAPILFFRRTHPKLMVCFLTFAVIASSQGEAYARWLLRGATVANADAIESRFGLRLAKQAEPDTTVAVVWAGSLPYFSKLPVIDLMGKMDKVIAKGPTQSKVFYPGHGKWNYRYSICELRPDIVASLWTYTTEELDMIDSCGYQHIGHRVYLRTDSNKISVKNMQDIVISLGKELDQYGYSRKQKPVQDER